MDDNGLLQELVAATGLPEELILQTLMRLLERDGINPSEASLDDIRRITADYLLEVFSEILDDGIRTPEQTA